MDDSDALQLKHHQLVAQLEQRAIFDPLLLKSFSIVPRHQFVPFYLQEYAYEDRPLPIGEEQTISQPYIVALMIQMAQLQPHMRVLEIGTGSGYSAAVLAHIVTQVYTIERIDSLALQAKQRFEQLNYKNIEIRVGDGSLGWPEQTTFDAIFVTAGAPIVPPLLLNQLAINGKLIIPVGNRLFQELGCYTKVNETEYTSLSNVTVRFVPLIGQQGWKNLDPDA